MIVFVDISSINLYNLSYLYSQDYKMKTIEQKERQR